MITFLLYSIVALIANASLAKIIHVSIQQGQWLDKLLNWQERLHRWDLTDRQFLAKAGGLCELCFSHLFTFIGFWFYALFMSQVVGFWVTTPVDGWVPVVVFNMLWYLAYVGIGTNLSLYFITKLFQE